MPHRLRCNLSSLNKVLQNWCLRKSCSACKILSFDIITIVCTAEMALRSIFSKWIPRTINFVSDTFWAFGDHKNILLKDTIYRSCLILVMTAIFWLLVGEIHFIRMHGGVIFIIIWQGIVFGSWALIFSVCNIFFHAIKLHRTHLNTDKYFFKNQ